MSTAYKGDKRNIISRFHAKRAHGIHVAKSESMGNEAEKLITVVKEYTAPAPQRVNDDDKLRHANVDLAYLRAELKRMKSRNARLESEIQSEIKMLTAALSGEQETYDQVKRRISRLKGALEYPGHQ